MNDHYAKNQKLREENVELANKLKSLIEQYELREKVCYFWQNQCFTQLYSFHNAEAHTVLHVSAYRKGFQAQGLGTSVG